MKPLVQRIAIGTGIFTAGWLVSTRAGQELLCHSRENGRRPRCMCSPGGIEMYVGRRGGTFYLSRMPGTGFLHADGCRSGEAVPLFSGANAYEPGTIVENSDGTLSIMVRLDLRDRPNEPLVEASIDGLMDILVEQANLNRTRIGDGPRTWQSVRDRIHEAADWIRLETARLSDLLFLPDRFTRETGAATQARCEDFIKSRAGQALICAPLKQMRQAHYGWQLILKHLPGLRLWVAREVAKQIETRWGIGWISSSPPEYALCLVAARPGRRDGNYTVTNMACMPTDAGFFPCRSIQESRAATRLLAPGAEMMRPLRFDLDPMQPLADFAILGGGMPEPVFVIAGNDRHDAARRSLADRMRRNHALVHVITE